MREKRKINPTLQIDPEFESKIPPLTEEEYEKLQENILTEGVVLMPLIVWDGTIVDGHNRYKIAQAHPHILFDVIEKDFANRYEALAWICNNQLGRRNLTPIQKKLLIGDQYEAEKMARGGDRKSEEAKSTGQIGQLISSNDAVTRQRIADEHGTNDSFVKRAGQYSRGITAAEEVSPGFRKKVLSGKITPTQKEIQSIARAAPEERKPLMDQIFDLKRGKLSKEEFAAMQKNSDDMAQKKPCMTAQKAVQQFEWKITRMLQSFDSTFFEWPQLIAEEIYRKQVIATLQDLQNYILQIEGGCCYEWDKSPLLSIWASEQIP